MQTEPIYLIGCPQTVGGASMEAWDTIKLWRAHGVEVNIIPTWEITQDWRQKVEAIGCRVYNPDLKDIGDVPGLRDGLAVAFCNPAFLRTADRWRALNLRITWVGCMTWCSPLELMVLRRDGPFDEYVFQSAYQARRLTPIYRKYGIGGKRLHRFVPAFDYGAVDYAPARHTPKRPFRVCRISRAAPDKFHPDCWQAIAGQKPRKRIAFEVLGFSRVIADKIGNPPTWATCHAPGAVPAAEVLARSHAMVHLVDASRENWPRVCLEALAAGVPFIGQNEWGLREMIREGHGGMLVNDVAEVREWLDWMVNDEIARVEIAERGRAHVERLCDPVAAMTGWRRVWMASAVRRVIGV